jgi:hypothetical protein
LKIAGKAPDHLPIRRLTGTIGHKKIMSPPRAAANSLRPWHHRGYLIPLLRCLNAAGSLWRFGMNGSLDGANGGLRCARLPGRDALSPIRFPIRRRSLRRSLRRAWPAISMALPRLFLGLAAGSTRLLTRYSPLLTRHSRVDSLFIEQFSSCSLIAASGEQPLHGAGSRLVRSHFGSTGELV